MTARFLDAALDDLEESARFYDTRNIGLGAEFVAEVRAAVERIVAFPEAWQSLDADHRRCRTHRFPFGVIYRIEPGEILIVAVAHLHQRPRRWVDRT